MIFAGLSLLSQDAAAMPLFRSVTRRHRQPEIMDQPDLAAERHFEALHGLERINRWSGSARLLWRPILLLARKSLVQPLRLLDVATGSGDVPIRIWHNARHAGLELQVAGCDRSPRAVDYARRSARACQAGVHFFPWDVIQKGVPGEYDIVTCSLFLHHLGEEQAIELVRAMAGAARHLLLINDLVRSRAGYVLAYLGTRVLSTSDIVHTDGPRSVQAAFTVEELLGLARRAGLAGTRVSNRWPCRMLLEWERS
jgi:2-polyprenyl-3-methyl-5-hydroxy-6-metoxy-1,4-benzoquinol methylase